MQQAFFLIECTQSLHICCSPHLHNIFEKQIYNFYFTGEQNKASERWVAKGDPAS